MIELLFASQNNHKRDEIISILGPEFKILSLKDLGYFENLEESFNSLEENALQKSRFVHSKFGMNCFSEDSGLEVDALNREPGVKSARYSGPESNSERNVELLLANMTGLRNRQARFRTVISLIFDDKEVFFEGICQGQIALEQSGNGGFGYDPVFMPNGYAKTFAEMDISVKNEISHRSMAFLKLKKFFAELSNR
jgi:XTP/dITP diphosphohydrolase